MLFSFLLPNFVFANHTTYVINGRTVTEPHQAGETDAQFNARKQKIQEDRKAAQLAALQKEEVACFYDAPGVDFGMTFDLEACAAGFANMALSFTNWLVSIASSLVDTAIDFSIVQMSKYTGPDSAVENGWIVVRDIANMGFIFILLYVAILTILRASDANTKRTIINLILIALLINFSLFLTKIIIDASNILALNFYQSAVGDSLGGKMLELLKLPTAYKAGEYPLSFGVIFTIGVMGSLLFLITAFVLFAAAILFLLRFVTLVLLMVLAPAAFIARILPQTEKYFSSWLRKLIDQSFFAPAFMILLLVSVTITEGFSKDVTKAFSDLANPGGLTASAQNTLGSVDVLLNFIVIIAFMIATLVIAKSFGAHGAATTMRWGKSAQKWGQGVIGRNTIGRASSIARKGFDAGAAAVTNPRQTLRNVTTGAQNVIANPGAAAKRAGKRVGKAVGAGALVLGDLATTGGLGTAGYAAYKGGAIGAAGRSTRETLQAGEKAKFGSGKSYEDSQKAQKVYSDAIQTEAEKQRLQGALANAKAGRASADDIRKIEEASLSVLKEIKEDLENPNVAEHLTQRQIEAMDKSSDFDDATVGKIRAARIKSLENKVAAGNITAVVDKIGNMGDKDQASVAAFVASSDPVSENMKPGTFKKFMDNKEITPQDKDTIRDKFESNFRRKSKTEIETYLTANNPKPEQLTALSDGVLRQPSMIENMSSRMLAAMDGKINDTTQDFIGDYIRNHPTSVNAKAHAYVTTGAGKDNW